MLWNKFISFFFLSHKIHTLCLAVLQLSFNWILKTDLGASLALYTWWDLKMNQIPSKEQIHTEKEPILSLFAFAQFADLLQTPAKWSSAGRAGRGPEDRALQAGWMWVTAQHPVASSKTGRGHSHARLKPFPALLCWIRHELHSQNKPTRLEENYFIYSVKA